MNNVVSSASLIFRLCSFAVLILQAFEVSHCPLPSSVTLHMSFSQAGELDSSSVHGIFQVRIPEWAAFSYSKGPSWSRDQTHVSCIVGFFTLWTTREAPSTCQCRRCQRHSFDPWVRKIPWRRKWQPIPVFQLGESHGQRSLVGYSLWGHKRVGLSDWATAHARTQDPVAGQELFLKRRVVIHRRWQGFAPQP